MKKEAEKQLSEDDSEGEDSEDESGSEQEDNKEIVKKQESEPEPIEGKFTLFLPIFYTVS